MSELLRGLTTMPIEGIEKLLKPIYSVHTLNLLFGFLVLFYAITLLSYWNGLPCADSVTCSNNIMQNFFGWSSDIYSVIVYSFYAYLLLQGVKKHSIFSFKAYEKILAATVFFKVIYIIFFKLWPILDGDYKSSDSFSSANFRTVNSKFFGLIFGELNIDILQVVTFGAILVILAIMTASKIN